MRTHTPTARTIVTARRALLARRRAVVDRYRTTRASEAAALDTSHIESIEAATDQWDASVLGALAESDARLLGRIASALTRLEDGTYGACVICRGAIDDARLAAMPEAVTCIECARSRSELGG